MPQGTNWGYGDVSEEIPFPSDANIALLIFHRLGAVEGKLDGVLKAVNDIGAENIRCEADRQLIKKQVSDMKGRQNWMTGVAVGASFFLAKLTNFIPIGH
jgi:hypothetical protein